MYTFDLSIRTELIHPFFAHFPIAMLLLVLVFKPLVMFLKPSPMRKQLELFVSFQLYIGVLFFIPVIVTGNMAADIVGGELCDYMAIYMHKQWAYFSFFSFILVAAVDLVVLIAQDRSSWKFLETKRFKFIILIMLAYSSFTVLKVGHYGGLLVYEQGAAIEAFTPTCQY